jgi:hypothetical protein
MDELGEQGWPFPGPDKSMVLTPAIAQLERLLAELEAISNDVHPELLRVKRENEELLRQRWEALDKQTEYQHALLDRQLACELQSAREEIEDFDPNTG